MTWSAERGVVPSCHRGPQCGVSLSRTTCNQESVDDRQVIALSSGESELHATVRGTATALGTKSTAKDYGNEVKVAWETDSWTPSDCGRKEASTRRDATRTILSDKQRSRPRDEVPRHQAETVCCVVSQCFTYFCCVRLCCGFLHFRGVWLFVCFFELFGKGSDSDFTEVGTEERVWVTEVLCVESHLG